MSDLRGEWNFNKRDMVLVVMVIILFISLLGFMLWWGGTHPQALPSDDDLAYRAMEGTGPRGQAEYYLFDKQGSRFKVTQDVFDSYNWLERK